MEGTDQVILEDFGQRIDLTRKIREVLVNYPEGTTIFKELIQNADDAGATTVRFCLDRRTHGVKSLLSDKLRQWQGPALLAYNDAVFTEADFSSICTIGGSKKKDQGWKTGRFGVGFNSVYHLTDLPSFVSDKYVVLFDPQGGYLPNVSSSNPGKRLDFVGSSALSYYNDQFSPYCAFGCNMQKSFRGTLFRFPLRSSTQAAVSKLSRQSYVEDDIISIFDQLYKESVFAMLFLKNIISVEMYVWNCMEDDPHKIYSCSIDSVNESISWHRQALQRISRSSEVGKGEIASFSLNFLRESFLGPDSEKKMATFLIIQSMASPSSKIGAFAANAAKEYDIQLLPWTSLAVCVSGFTSEDDILNEGQAFCFLPLPVKTGLRVQVNGYFEVSSNRRSIWFGDDMDRGGKLRSEWNKLLLEDVIAPVFIELLICLSKQLGPSGHYYSLWPCGSFDVPWKLLVAKIYENISASSVVYSDIGKGRWLSPLNAFFHDVKFSKSAVLLEALLSLGMPVVSLPPSVVEMLFLYVPDLHRAAINPAIVRCFVKKSEVLADMNRDHRLVLLEYSLCDLTAIEVAKNAIGLRLIPLADGGFTSFSTASAMPSVFICGEFEYILLEEVSDQVVDRRICPELFSRLNEIAMTSSTNIKLFKPPHLLEIFPRIFPAEWKYKSGVPWNVHPDLNHPTESWFRLFWQYLCTHHVDLSIFSDWAILPSTSGKLYRALKPSNLINPKYLTDSMENILVKLGCSILDKTYHIEHEGLHQFVHEANAGAVLDAILDVAPPGGARIQGLFQVLSDEEKNELRSFLLDPKWYFEGFMNESQIAYCKKLPIYRVYDRISASFPFSDLEIPKKYLPPSNVPEHLLGGKFIFCSSDGEKDILEKCLGIKHMEKTVFYKENVFTRISELPSNVCDQVMTSILQDLPQLCSHDKSFKETLRNLEFVPTINGSRKSPISLYDPRIEELFDLLQHLDCFPHSSFQEPGILSMLQYLGLKTSILVETIIQCARYIESLIHTDQMKAYSHGKALLSYLEVNSGKWVHKPRFDKMFLRGPSSFKPPELLQSELEKFWNDLKMISWCPVLVKAPFPDLPWPTVSSILAPPRLVRLQADLWLVSASMRILDGECFSSALSSALGWSSPPSASIITAQLLELGKNNEIVLDQALRQELAVAMPRIYSLMMGLIGSDEMDIIKAILEGCRWIWVGDGFATVEEVVLSGHLYLAPFVRIIPVDLAAFRELFLEMGVQESLKPNDYANILCRISRKKNGRPLDRQELNMAIIIVQHLADVCYQGMNIKVYIPDTSSILYPATDLMYNDAPWLLDPGDDLSLKKIPNIDVYKFVHGSISSDVAEKLGVRSFRSILLAESSDSMKFSLYGVAEAFGQHETLTTRLKHIIEMYADGPGVLFELVQNADDAGASEVNFLLDRTQYGTSSILSPEMADWQGPALYCFNDSVFSPQDLYAISRIGQDGKLEKPLSIGRFGLGFNSVYHFTDVPGFVSGENIVIFDPHASHLPGISPSHPGLRIKYVGKSILEQFPDQFAPFLHFGCNLNSPFPGTLFRFPLRNEVAAARSHIKKEKYSPQDVLSLFSSFSDAVSEALLFLRNVKTISIFVKDGPDHEMSLAYHVSRLEVNEPDKVPHPFHSLLDFVRGTKSNGLTVENFLERLGRTADRDLPWNCQKIAVVERQMSGENMHFWFVSECISGGDAKKNSILFAKKSHKFIPWGCVAAHLFSINDKEIINSLDSLGQISHEKYIQYRPLEYLQNEKEFVGRTFCFLPLPISTGLPVHLNSYFELSSNRRDIWYGDDMAGGGKIRSEWNISLLVNVIAPAYARFLNAVALEIGPCDWFFSFWPTLFGAEPWNSLVTAVYKSIVDLGLSVLYTRARGGMWISARQCIFPDFSFPKENILSEALSSSGLPLVTITKPIAERFLISCPSLHVLNPSLLRRLLVKRKREFQNKDAMLVMLQYCLSNDENSAYYNDLYGIPLVPLADGSFTTFKKYGEGERLFIASESGYDLLKNSLSHLLIDREIPEPIFMKLSAIAESKKFNISMLTCRSLVELFPRILPPEWNDAKRVTWNPGQRDHPSIQWMQIFWSYLKSNCDDLTIFNKWPILPIGESDLFQLVPNSNIIKNEGWSENMSFLLQKIGCLFLRTDIEIEHPQLKIFVQSSTAPGVLNAVKAVVQLPQDLGNTFACMLEGEIHELRSFLLQTKWFSGNLMEFHHVDMIKLLPLFETYRTRKFVSLTNPTKWLKPEGIDEFLLDENFIRTESGREKAILSCHMNIREPSKAEFYLDHFLHRIPTFLSQPSVFSSVVTDLKNLIDGDNSLRTVLAEYPFILSASGSWLCASRLYDPCVPGLKKLLHNNYFPSDHFSSPETLEMLRFMGLKRNLDPAGLLDSARSVSILQDSGDPDALIYGKRLISCMCAVSSKLSSIAETQHSGNLSLFSQNNDSLEVGEDYTPIDSDVDACLLDFHEEFEDGFWIELRKIPWCPVSVLPPMKGIPWVSSETLIASPDITRPKSQMWTVSSRMRILDCECSSAYLQQRLGWFDDPDLGILCSQLMGISMAYESLKLDSEERTFLDSALQREIPVIYSKLQHQLDSDDFKIARASLTNTQWVWVGDNFVSSSSLAFDSPIKFPPYMYVVPSELSEFRPLLLALDVRLMFSVTEYLHVLQQLHRDLKGGLLSPELLDFVLCVLEAIADCFSEKAPNDGFLNSLLVPDLSGSLICASDVVYNDAPWMEKSFADKIFVHPSLSEDLSKRLGLKSLRTLSFVNDEMTKDIPCMGYSKISELLHCYGGHHFLLFDILELADCCEAKNVHIIYDKRNHPRQSLLQHNLGDFQGPGLIAIIEGTTLNREELCGLQLSPPWKLRGVTLNYGLGLLSCHSVSDFLSVVSGGHLYMFDPLGLAFSSHSSNKPSAKMFSFIGNDLTKTFRDQFLPMMMHTDGIFSTKDSTIIRMPLSSRFEEESGASSTRIEAIFDDFIANASSTLLSLKSVLKVCLSTWEVESPSPSLDYSVSINTMSAIARNPFSNRKWRKFHISQLFNSSNATTKSHVIDLQVFHRGEVTINKWLVVSSLGSGQTRNMALDKRYLAYNLNPVGGVAAHISQNGLPVNPDPTSCILSPLALSQKMNLPVTIMGCFLLFHKGGRYLFDKDELEVATNPPLNSKRQLAEAWNKELMLCVRDSYMDLVLELQKIQGGSFNHKSDDALSAIVSAYGDDIYSFWPRTPIRLSTDANRSDWEYIIQSVIRPFYERIVDLPVWRLYRGDLVKANEGMFLSQSSNDTSSGLPPGTVCSFIKEHYPVFSVPSDLVSEIIAVGFNAREIKPPMVRSLLKASRSVVLRSMEIYLDVLDYCVSDIQDLLSRAGPDAEYLAARSLDAQTLNSISNNNQDGDALEIMGNFGRVLYDFGRGVVEDIARSGNLVQDPGVTVDRLYLRRTLQSVGLELKGLPFPTARKNLSRLGDTELWIGNKEQQLLMSPLGDKFLDAACLERPALSYCLLKRAFHGILKLEPFSPYLLSQHLKSIFSENWVRHVLQSNQIPWIPWEKSESAAGPSPEWIKLFWKTFNVLDGDLSLVSNWPFIPCFVNRTVLCRIKDRNLVFIPPVIELENSDSESDSKELFATFFEMTKSRYPWLFLLLNQCNIPVYDMDFSNEGAPSICFPPRGRSLGQEIASKILVSKRAGYFLVPEPFSHEDRDRLFELFISDFKSSTSSPYKNEEIDILRELPIYKTTIGSYTSLCNDEQCLIPSGSFFHPKNIVCLSCSSDENAFYQFLRVNEINNREILVRFALPGFEDKTLEEQESILKYIYMNWQEIQLDNRAIDALKESCFVRNTNESCSQLFKPTDLLDPCDPLLMSLFSEERERFPGERFTSEGWLGILKKTGLRTSSKADVLLECAKKLELNGKEAMKHLQDQNDDIDSELTPAKGIPSEQLALAESLVEMILANFVVLYDSSFCGSLSTIAFVPAEKGFPSIGGKKGGKKVFCAFSEAILLKDWPLAWSCSPIIVKESLVPPEFARGALKFRSPPPFSTVLKHLQAVGEDNGEDVLAHWPASMNMMTVDESCCVILKYLDSRWNSLSSSEIEDMRNVAFIPVANGTRLVNANSLFVRLTVNLSPFAFELPEIYLPFMKILKELGIRDLLSISYAKDLLLNIQKSCGYQRLNPNELRAVMELIHLICIDETHSSRLSGLEWYPDAIIPDDGCRLVAAKSCVYIDVHGSKFLGCINTSMIRFAHPQIPERICLSLQIKKLSDVVIEDLEEHHQLVVQDEIGKVPLSRMREKLESKTLFEALWLTVSTSDEGIASLEGLTLETLQLTLHLISNNLQFVKQIHTRFLLLPKRVDITKRETTNTIPEWEIAKHRTTHFVDKSTNNILVAEPPSYISVYDSMATVVSLVLGLATGLPIGPLFSCPPGSEMTIARALKMGSPGRKGKREKQTLGEELVPQDAHQVQFYPLRPFYAGEIIAWRIQKDGEKLKYGRVVNNVRPSSGQSLYRFAVETAAGKTQSLLSSQVFSFRSVSFVSDHGVASTSISSQPSTSEQPDQEEDYGRVSPAEMIHAVHEMLSASGINMDAEKQALMQMNLTLQEQLRESEAALLVEQEKTVSAVKEADAAKTAWVCRICLGVEVDVVMIPCGHVLCRNCSAAVAKCPFCRARVTNIVKIFRP